MATLKTGYVSLHDFTLHKDYMQTVNMHFSWGTYTNKQHCIALKKTISTLQVMSSIMRRSNCSAPIPPRGSPGVRGKVCV